MDITKRADKLLVIGLDGGTFDVLEDLARRGVMPNLGRLMALSSWGTLRSTIPPVTAPAWTSFLTGKNPGAHGIYQFFALNPLSADSLGMGHKTYLALPGIVVNGSSIPGKKLWTLIDESGKKQITLNIPMAYPPEKVNGIMVTGMLTPPGSRLRTWPTELAEQLDGYEIDLDPKEKDFSGDDGTFLRRVEEILGQRLHWSLKLMRENPWDFFMVVITETDRLQHRYYDILHPAGREGAPSGRRRLIPALENLYRRVDNGLAELVEAAGKDTNLIILSDHGFGPAPVDLVDLRRLGACLDIKPRSPALKPPSGSMWRKFKPTKARLYRYLGFLPQSWLTGFEAAWRRRRLRRQSAILVKMHENIGGVWINRRDASGKITDPAGHAELKSALKAGLLKVAWEGEPIVSQASFREELYRGPYLDSAPDIIFLLRDRFGIAEPDVDLPGDGLVRRVSADRPRKRGTHRIDGMFLLAGPGVASGRGHLQAGIEDMTAAALYMLGIPIPDDMDGRVPVEAFQPGILQARPIQAGASGGDTRPTPRAYDADEEAAIKARLEGIGYLD